jgi:cation diffusion facilitator CzcD-associated flavoprotein CzcO
LQPEIHRYFESVVSQYDIRPHVRFHSAVVLAEYDPETASWKVVIEDQRTKHRIHKRCRILVSAIGVLSTSKRCDIPGAENFKGRLFHSALWDHGFDYKDKEVICVGEGSPLTQLFKWVIDAYLLLLGNGCSATQFVPVMSAGQNQVKKITQFSRQAHWLSYRPNPEYSGAFQFLMRWVPGAQRLYRTYLFLTQEKDFAGFHMKNGQNMRNDWTATTTEYIQKNSPTKYRDFLVPNTIIGCKRRVMDTDYLACLHRKNVELIYDDPIDHITESGIMTKSGRKIDADAIVLANGFETQKPFFPMEIRGQNGQNIADHVSQYQQVEGKFRLIIFQWLEFADGSPEAYFGTCLSGFPNFFILMGPNTLSGHLSVLYTTECQVNFIIRVIRPILDGLNRSILPSLFVTEYPESVVVTPVAERKDVAVTDHKAKQLVWATGCTSWFIDPSTGRNTIMFPDWQFKFHLRSIFIPWTDFLYKKSPKGSLREVTVVPRYPLGVATASIKLLGALLRLSSAESFKLSSTLTVLQQHVSGFLPRTR